MIRFLDIRKITESFQPDIGEAVARAVQSGNYIRGKEGQQFEEAYAAFTGTAHCVGVGNGFDALRLIFKAWILSGAMQEGDEVIVPANTYIASVLAVTENRLIPVLVEPDSNTLVMDAARIEEKISSRTKAVMVVHLYGRNAMHPDIYALAERYRLKVVEDNAQAAGCFSGVRRTGSLGDAAAHSFFPTKNLGALGDAGAVTTNDSALAQAVRTLGNYGSSAKGFNELAGLNSRLDELQAAVLNVKLARLDQDNERRRNGAMYYTANITNPLVLLPQIPPPHSANEHVWHLFVIRSPYRDELRQYLMQNNIEAFIHYPIPPHKQGAYRTMNHLNLPVTEMIHREVLSLPLNPVIGMKELAMVADAVNAFSQ